MKFCDVSFDKFFYEVFDEFFGEFFGELFDKFFDELFSNFFDEFFDEFFDKFLTYNLLTIASFRIGVRSILLFLFFVATELNWVGFLLIT